MATTINNNFTISHYVKSEYKFLSIGTSSVNTTNEMYFDIDANGLVSLKPEYRGIKQRDYSYSGSDSGESSVGSKIDNLPNYLYVPKMISDVIVTGFQDGAFAGNPQITHLYLPKGITVLSSGLCYNMENLTTINNIEDVVVAKDRIFTNSQLLKTVNLPNVAFLGERFFQNCGSLQQVVLGELVTSIPNYCFDNCKNLKNIVIGNNVHSIGNYAFRRTYNIREINKILDSVSNFPRGYIGDLAFMCSGVEYDWKALVTKENPPTFGNNPTPYHWNNDNYDAWVAKQSSGTLSYNISPLPTKLSQGYKDWSEKIIGAAIDAPNKSEVQYMNGCHVVSAMNAYCGKNEFTVESPPDVETKMLGTAKDEDSLKSAFTNYTNGAQAYIIAEKAGCTARIFTSGIKSDGMSASEGIDAFYDALQTSKQYVLSSEIINGNPRTDEVTHTVCLYGSDSKGRVYVADSGNSRSKQADTALILPQNIYVDNRRFEIIS